jgi:ribonuclease HII
MDTWWHFLDQRGLSFDRVLGVDEAGRGPLAGPVVVAGVILPKDHGIVGLDDSKMLSETQREALFEQLTQLNPSNPSPSQQIGEGSPLSRGELGHTPRVEIFVEKASAAMIDKDGILVVTRRLMRRIVKKAQPEIALLDAVNVDAYETLQLSLVKGDQRVDCIAAASIIAKVTRDRLMQSYDKRYPGYGLAQHKGYGTAFHRAQLEERGLTKVHRKTFCSYLLESTDHPP